MKTKNDIIADGYVLVEHKSGSTWNDGGSWNEWVYVLPETQEYIKVTQPTDYRNDVEITKVEPHVETVVSYVPVAS